MTDVVCIGAHPDDVEIGMGATVATMAAEGLSVAIIDLTDGEPTPFGDPRTRAREAARASEILGVAERRTLTLPNRELADTLEARRMLAEVLRELRPRWLFLPYPLDAHPDHVAAASLGSAARFWAKLTKTDMDGEPHYPERVYHYVAVHLRLHVKPSFIVDATAGLDAKLAALGAYASQFSANPANRGIIELVRERAAYWGGLIGTGAGEPFYAQEEIGIRSVRDLL